MTEIERNISDEGSIAPANHVVGTALHYHKANPQDDNRNKRPQPAFNEAFHDKRTPDVSNWRAHELHDVNFFSPRDQRKPDDAGHRQRRREDENRRQRKTDGPDDPHGFHESLNPSPIVAHVGDAGETPSAEPASDSTAAGSAFGRSRISNDAGSGFEGRSPAASASAPKFCLNRRSASSFDTASTAATNASSRRTFSIDARCWSVAVSVR